VYKQPTKISFENLKAEKRKSQAQEEHVPIEDLKIGEYFTMALTKSGSVYCWGSNICG